MKKKKQYSLKTRIMGIVMLGWFVPFLLVAGMVGYYLFGDQLEATINQQRIQLAFNLQNSEERLNACIDSAKKISYDADVDHAYRSYLAGETTQKGLMNAGNQYLYKQYRHDAAVRDVILWFTEQPESMRCEVYNLSAGGGYPDVGVFWNSDYEAVQEKARELGTRVDFIVVDGRIYLVRNLMNSAYEPFAVMVVRLNKSYCFENLTNFVSEAAVTVQLNDQNFTVTGESVTEEEIPIKNLQSVSGYVWKNEVLRLFRKTTTDHYQMTVRVRLSEGVSFTPFFGYRMIMIIMVLFLLPLLTMLLYITRRYITKPVEGLMSGARKIEQGELGYQMVNEPHSQEFKYLADSFNSMSSTLKYQFDHIYEEEMALRDAQFMALQANINPHFMNNTLEIINWEARIAGNYKVSRMIEALSTLLDGALNRDKKAEVLLSEEMVYVNDYLFITAERFGKRLTVYNHLPEDIMECEVPRLILQPLIENAIEHGVLKRGSGRVELNGYREGDYLYLVIINEAVLTGDQQKRIDRLLSPDYDVGREASESLGIANVNQRLRILYGEPCGLTIRQRDNECVEARLTILVNKEHKIIQ